jgi:hypothetical protein
VSSTRTTAWAGGAPWLGEILAGHLAWCRGTRSVQQAAVA